MRKLNDFGAKIGGAKKDIWAIYKEATEDERTKMARKTALWKHPKYDALEKSGIPREVLFWRDMMRDAVISKPADNAEQYMSFVIEFKSDVEECKTLDDIKDFYKGTDESEPAVFKYLKKTSDDPKDKHWQYADEITKPFFDGNMVLKYVYKTKRIKEDCDNSHFMETFEERENKKYTVLRATSENMESGPYAVSRFRNKVKAANGIFTFFDDVDFMVMLKESEDNTLYIPMYENKSRLGVFLSEDEAASAIAKDKAKRTAKREEKKETFLPPHLSYIERTGSSYDFFRFSDGGVLLARYGLRGGEFGNYTTSKDRIASVNMAYDAFEDLYKSVGISPKDISLGNKLAIAFGARGRGNAMAHYEPVKNVINITKKRGAGSLAHEWGHALDMYIGKKFGCHGFASTNLKAAGIPDSLKNLVLSFTEQDGEQTEFYEGSMFFDGEYKKSGNGYWSSANEMFARAFACYVKDKLGDNKSDYLVGHSECAKSGVKIAYPRGKEREVIDKYFDEFFEDMIERRIFAKYQAESEEKKNNSETVDIEDMFFEGQNGQMMFF